MSRPSEAERLRACRETFERARRERVSMAEARRRIAEERWRAAEQRLAERRAAAPLCGTEAPAFVAGDAEEARALQWWQK